MQQQQQQQQNQPSLRNTFNLAYFAATAHSRCVTPFLRDQVGCEANGFPAFAAFVGMLLYGGMTNEGRVVAYVGVWLLALAMQRVDSSRCRFRGMIIHSHSAGRPQLALRLAPRIKDANAAKLGVEPMLCVIAGWALHFWSEAVAMLVASSAASLIVVELFDRQIRRHREQSVIDARLEMQALENGVRQRLGY